MSQAYLQPRYLTRLEPLNRRHESVPRSIASAPPPMVTHPEDLALVRDALARRPAAVATLGERLQCIGPMTRSRRRSLAPWIPDTDLPDLEQEVASKVLERLPSYRGLAALESWVFAFCDGVVRNAARSHRRKQARDHQLEAAADHIDADRSAGTSDSDNHEDLYACLEGLTRAERELVQGKHHDGLQLAELAARLGAGLNTIKSRYFRILQKLRLCLERKRGGAR